VLREKPRFHATETCEDSACAGCIASTSHGNLYIAAIPRYPSCRGTGPCRKITVDAMRLDISEAEHLLQLHNVWYVSTEGAIDGVAERTQSIYTLASCRENPLVPLASRSTLCYGAWPKVKYRGDRPIQLNIKHQLIVPI
jgi:hypothetical protein